MSPSGRILVLTVAAMLVGAMNYGNNMAYILCFLIVSLMVVAWLQTRNNIRSLEVLGVQAKTAFAGGDVEFVLQVRNNSPQRRMALYLAAFGPEADQRIFGPFSLPPHGESEFNIQIPAHKRGMFILNGVTFLTGFPFGFFRVWRTQMLDIRYLIYPRPAGSLAWPEAETADDGVDYAEGHLSRGGDDFSGLRPYREGESQRHIDWKAVARGRPKAVKEFSGGGRIDLWFAWELAGGVNEEARISQMTRWVLEADQMNVEFGLRVPGVTIDPASGSRHTRECLRALALYGGEE